MDVAPVTPDGEATRNSAGRVSLWPTTTPICATMSCGCSRTSCEVEAVPDGQAALDAIRMRLPDLLLTDVMMPRLDGFGLLAAIRADRSCVTCRW